MKFYQTPAKILKKLFIFHQELLLVWMELNLFKMN